MKKSILLVSLLLSYFISIGQETPPTILKPVNAQFYINPADSSIWHQKGRAPNGTDYGWERLGRYKDISTLDAASVKKIDSANVANNYVTYGKFISGTHTLYNKTLVFPFIDFLKLTSGIDAAATPTGNSVILGNAVGTNTFAFKGSNNNVAGFNSGGLTTGQVFYLPDATTTLVGTDNVATLSNKTLVAPKADYYTGTVRVAPSPTPAANTIIFGRGLLDNSFGFKGVNGFAANFDSYNLTAHTTYSLPNNAGILYAGAGTVGSIAYSPTVTTTASLPIGAPGTLLGYVAGLPGYIDYDNIARTLTNKSIDGLTNTLTNVTATNAAKWTTPRTVSITGDISYTSPPIDGTGDVTAVATLPNVNPNVGTWGTSSAVPTVVVNAKGQVTGAGTIGIAIAESQVTNLVPDLAAKAPLISPALTTPTADNLTLTGSGASGYVEFPTNTGLGTVAAGNARIIFDGTVFKTKIGASLSTILTSGNTATVSNKNLTAVTNTFPVFPDANISSATNWNTAFSWGNHAGLYLGLHSTADNSTLWNSQSFTPSGLAAGDIMQYNGSTWNNAANNFSAPLHRSGGTTGIDNAVANGSTRGAASFTAADFDDNSGGNISIDYTNGQAASTSAKGFLTAADWNIFNGKAPLISPSFTTPTADALVLTQAVTAAATPTGVNVVIGHNSLVQNTFAFKGSNGFMASFSSALLTGSRGFQLPDVASQILTDISTVTVTNKNLTSATNTFPSTLLTTSAAASTYAGLGTANSYSNTNAYHGNTYFDNFITINNTGSPGANSAIIATGLTAPRNHTLPNKDGVFAMLSDLTNPTVAYADLTGITTDGIKASYTVGGISEVLRVGLNMNVTSNLTGTIGCVVNYYDIHNTPQQITLYLPGAAANDWQLTGTGVIGYNTTDISTYPGTVVSIQTIGTGSGWVYDLNATIQKLR